MDTQAQKSSPWLDLDRETFRAYAKTVKEKGQPESRYEPQMTRTQRRAARQKKAGQA